MGEISPVKPSSYHLGTDVYGLWKNGLYPDQILIGGSADGGGGENTYFVHYDGYYEDYDSWVLTTRIYTIKLYV